jgi:hypothetical protein
MRGDNSQLRIFRRHKTKFDFATSRNTDNIYSIDRPPHMSFHLGNVD